LNPMIGVFRTQHLSVGGICISGFTPYHGVYSYKLFSDLLIHVGW